MAAEQKGGQVGVNISLAILHWEESLLPWHFDSDILLMGNKGDGKHQSANQPY